MLYTHFLLVSMHSLFSNSLQPIDFFHTKWSFFSWVSLSLSPCIFIALRITLLSNFNVGLEFSTPSSRSCFSFLSLCRTTVQQDSLCLWKFHKRNKNSPEFCCSLQYIGKCSLFNLYSHIRYYGDNHVIRWTIPSLSFLCVPATSTEYISLLNIYCFCLGASHSQTVAPIISCCLGRQHLVLLPFLLMDNEI